MEGWLEEGETRLDCKKEALSRKENAITSMSKKLPSFRPETENGFKT